jgi:hypothetical protein
MKASTFWDVTVPRVMTIYANAVFVVLWVGFVIALAANREWLDAAWNWTGALPLVPKIIVWVLLLPILVGLWIWESSWSTFGRLVGLAGIVGWTLLAVSSIFKYFRKV